MPSGQHRKAAQKVLIDPQAMSVKLSQHQAPHRPPVSFKHLHSQYEPANLGPA